MKIREAHKALKRVGFVPIRDRGDHRHYQHPDGRRIHLPTGSWMGRELGKGWLGRKVKRLVAGKGTYD